MGGTQTRGKGIYPNQKGGNLLTGKKTNKKYANSLKESANVSEAELQEDDLILVPGQGHKLKTGFIPHGQSRVDHEVEMARSDLFQAVKNARTVHELLKDRSEDEGLEGWVQEKIIKAADYLNTVREYLEGKQMQEAGVIAGGGVGESVAEGAKVDRMVKHIKKSEMKTGKSADKAEDIAWATVNKRGYLDNVNKKKGK
jgi:hypothetical protein